MKIEELNNLPDSEKAKIFAAYHALEMVRALVWDKRSGDDVNIGIGTGSTAAWFVRLLAHDVADDLEIRACATSFATTELAESLGIKIEPLDAFIRQNSFPPLDLVIDGADEFDSDHNLIKGGGGALLQEKIVAQSAMRFIVITDESKAVSTLGKFPLPVEVVRFGWQTTLTKIVWWVSARSNTGDVKATRRMVDGEPFITDEGHYILDLDLDFIRDPVMLNDTLGRIAGVVDSGLFLGMANEIIMADSEGLVKSQETGKDWVETPYHWGEASLGLMDDEE